MRLFDHFISKWANTFIKSLMVFCIIYISVIFIRIESRITKFEIKQEKILFNQTNIINDIQTIKYTALSNLTNQGVINLGVQSQIDNK